MNFIKVSAACPKTNIADIEYNILNIKECIKVAVSKNSKLIVFPELSITSYTVQDLFSHEVLLTKTLEALNDLCLFSKNLDILIAVGAPLVFRNKLFNTAVIIHNGKILGIVPKSYIPNYSEFYEKRWFAEGLNIKGEEIDFDFQQNVPFGTDLIFKCKDLTFGFEICEDLWVTVPPSSYLSLQGTVIIGNLSASNELISKCEYRRNLVQNQSARCICSYVYSSAGVNESTTDLVFSGHLLISENGSLLKENKRFCTENEVITSVIDVEKLINERIKNMSFKDASNSIKDSIREIKFDFKDTSIGNFDRYIDKHPFVPSDEQKRDERCQEILNIQAFGLRKRLLKTNLKNIVIGISGGLDSTLALIACIKTADILGLPRKNIKTITMPGFGTTDRTYNNAVNLCKNLGTDLREINIVKACLQHFSDIGHKKEIHDVTYENVQARERTQILMDIANKEKGILVGTGDLSELALGWCTYNGDHMSMYSVNCSIPKTLVRYIVKYAALKEFDKNTSNILLDILNTPVTPELLPKGEDGKIVQKTEDIIGPYELHDFFLYYFIRQGASKDKMAYLAKIAFKGDYEPHAIDFWLDKFIKRFFTQQFKRSALPDGPKLGTISLSPRGDWRMSSDVSYNTWL